MFWIRIGFEFSQLYESGSIPTVLVKRFMAPKKMGKIRKFVIEELTVFSFFKKAYITEMICFPFLPFKNLLSGPVSVHRAFEIKTLTKNN
jgi:hypothetical protein